MHVFKWGLALQKICRHFLNFCLFCRKVTTWLYLQCSWPARSQTCQFSSGLQHCWKVENDLFLFLSKTQFVILELHRQSNLCRLLGKTFLSLSQFLTIQALFKGFDHVLCLQIWTRLLGTPWMPMKPPRCTRTFPSSFYRTTSLPAAFLSITSSVYVKATWCPRFIVITLCY